MNKSCAVYIIAVLLTITGCARQAPSYNAAGKHQEPRFSSFVTVQGDQLVDENGPLRFISYNIPCLHYNEDYLPFDETNNWRFPDEFEIRDALESVRQMGGRVVRTYTLSVRKVDDDPAIPRHVLGPGQFNEDAFVALDKVLQIANEKGIRLIVPFVNNHQWWGGIAEYAGFRGKPKDAFWTDPEIFEDSKKTIAYVVNRKNTFTGVYYKDDKAILGWQTGNELRCPHEWTIKTAAYIKSLDKKHLVIDGFCGNNLRQESIDAPQIDVVTSHHYSRNADQTIEQIKENKSLTKGKKPYFVGEFGFLPTPDIERILNTVIETKTSGALIWSLRKHNRDGGFYWHSEPLGDDLYKAYHWPGFKSGQLYDEANVLHLMRNKAFEIREKHPPALEPPPAPVLLPVADVPVMSWQGSVGAASYTIQRSQQPNGPWKTIKSGVDDAWIQYRPLYNDTSAQTGQEYYYRILAENSAGKSPPSNVVGPVYVVHRMLIDEMQDLSLIAEQQGDMSFESQQARKFKEDMHRLKASKDASITYELSEPICYWKVYTFFEKNPADLNVSLSKDGKQYWPAETDAHSYFGGKGSYGYYMPVEYIAQADRQDARYLKITFTGTTYISRVEIAYSQPDSSGISSPVGFVKGFSWGWWGYRGQYEGSAPKESMQKLAATHSNWVCISFGAEMETFDSPAILWSDNNPNMVSDKEIRRAIGLARDNGLKVILKPAVNVRDTTWRAWIKFNHEDGTKDMQAWKKWWQDYQAMLIHYARIAEETHCEMLCLGCEMESTEEWEDQWRAMIADIRKGYKGALTYNANWGREDAIKWWDALDVISMSAYYPVGSDNANQAIENGLDNAPASDSTIKAIKRRWLPIKQHLAAISYKHKRPILFIELGVCSGKGFTSAPWTHPEANAVYDGDEQWRYYQATLETFWNEPWFMGFTWWAWLPNLYTLEEAKSHTGFCIYGKPAEKLVTEWYAKQRE